MIIYGTPSLDVSHSLRSNNTPMNNPAHIPNKDGYKLTIIRSDGRQVPDSVCVRQGRYTLTETPWRDVIGWLPAI